MDCYNSRSVVKIKYIIFGYIALNVNLIFINMIEKQYRTL